MGHNYCKVPTGQTKFGGRLIFLEPLRHKLVEVRTPSVS